MGIQSKRYEVRLKTSDGMSVAYGDSPYATKGQAMVACRTAPGAAFVVEVTRGVVFRNRRHKPAGKASELVLAMALGRIGRR